MKIGILQCGHAADEVRGEHGDFDRLFANLLAGQGFTFETWNVVDMEFPASPLDADGWLLTGSKHGTYDDLPFIAPLEDFIRAAYETDRKIVGICFGHQLIAQALGGTVEKFDGGWAIGRQSYNFADQTDCAINAWHQDQVTDLPKDATVIAENDFCKYAGLVYGKKAFTMQPHPEMSNPVIKAYVEVRAGTANYPDALMQDALANSELSIHDQEIAKKIGGFFHGTHNPVPL